jgi:hypothetical protein
MVHGAWKALVLTLLVGVLLALAVAACGGSVAQRTSVSPQPSPAHGASGTDNPAVVVAWTPDSGPPSHVYTAALFPKGNPSGIIALKRVRNGHTQTLASYAFRTFQSPGSVTVKAGRGALRVTWSVPGTGSGKEGARVVFQRRSKELGDALGSITVGRGNMRSEQDIWALDRYVGASPRVDSLTMASFAKLVSESVQYPRRTAYCLTLEVDAR